MTLRVEVPEKVLNADQCKCNPCGGELKKAEMKWNKRLKEYIRETWEFRSKLTVEPFVVCYILPSVLAGLAVQNLCFEKSCVVNLNYDLQTCRHIMQGRTANYSVQEKKVQTMVTMMTAWSYPLQTALPGILSLFLGAWSDRTGNRKTFMMLPIIGKIIATLGLILSTVFFFQVGLSETAIIEGVPPALAGGRVAMTMAVYSYITDITTESERTFRLGIITAIFTLSRPIGLALSGYMTHRFGYYGIFSVACVFYVVGFIYIVLRLKPTTKKIVESEEKQSCFSLFCFSDFVATVNVVFMKRQGTRRLQIFLILFAYMLIVGPVLDFVATVNVAFMKRHGTHPLQIFLILLAYIFVVGPVLGEAQMTYWFTRYKFQFTEVDYSLFLTYSFLIGTIGSFITIYLFAKRWNMDDSVIGVIACVSRIGASVVYAIAPTRSLYFLGPILDMFSSAGATSLRSMATKLVHSDEIGKTSSLISISEALVTVIYSPIYSVVYLNTLSSFPGAFYLISAALAVPAISLMIVLYCLHSKEVKDQDQPENKPKENEITNF